MCGRFEANISKEKLIQKFGIKNWQLDYYKPRYNIPPGTHIPIIRKAGDQRIINAAHWGLIPSWSKDKKIAYRMFNALSYFVFFLRGDFIFGDINNKTKASKRLAIKM